MKNIDIVNIVNVFLHGTGELSLPASVAWKRRLNMKKLIEAKAIIDEALREIDVKYADEEHSEKMDDGSYKVKPEYFEEFVNAKDEILLQDTDIDVKKVSIDDLGDINLTDAQMDTLAFMIAEE